MSKEIQNQPDKAKLEQMLLSAQKMAKDVKKQLKELNARIKLKSITVDLPEDDLARFRDKIETERANATEENRKTISQTQLIRRFIKEYLDSKPAVKNSGSGLSLEEVSQLRFQNEVLRNEVLELRTQNEGLLEILQGEKTPEVKEVDFSKL